MTAVVVGFTLVILGVLGMHAYASYLWSKERERWTITTRSDGGTTATTATARAARKTEPRPEPEPIEGLN